MKDDGLLNYRLRLWTHLRGTVWELHWAWGHVQLWYWSHFGIAKICRREWKLMVQLFGTWYGQARGETIKSVRRGTFLRHWKRWRTTWRKFDDFWGTPLALGTWTEFKPSRIVGLSLEYLKSSFQQLPRFQTRHNYKSLGINQAKWGINWGYYNYSRLFANIFPIERSLDDYQYKEWKQNSTQSDFEQNWLENHSWNRE